MVTVQEVVARVGNGVRLMTPAQQTPREVRGAGMNEHFDPRAWLEEGELLMTDGMGIPLDSEGQQTYVGRLAGAGVAALALGVGPSLRFRSVPRGLVASCRRYSIPLIRVPETMPFVRIIDTVYALIHQTDDTSAGRMVEAQRQLTRAASRPRSSDAVVAALARLTGLWVCLLGVDCQTMAGGLPGSVSIAEVTAAIASTGERVGGSAVIRSRTGRARVETLGTERVRGYLAYGSAEGTIGESAAALASFAVTLMSIDLERKAVVTQLQRRPVADATARLLAGVAPGEARRILTTVGLTASRLIVGLADGGSDREATYERVLAAMPDALASLVPEGTVILVPSEAMGIRERLSTATGGRSVGLSGPVRPETCPVGLRQARQALSIARRRGGVVDAMSLASTRLLLQLGDQNTLRAFADEVLLPLEQDDRVRDDKLLAVLMAWFVNDCSGERAAARLGMHRHTFRSRLHRIEEATHLRLDNPRDRATLWLALEARDVATTVDT